MDLIHSLQPHSFLLRVSSIGFPTIALPVPVILFVNLAEAKYITNTNSKVNTITIIIFLINVFLYLEFVIYFHSTSFNKILLNTFLFHI